MVGQVCYRHREEIDHELQGNDFLRLFWIRNFLKEKLRNYTLTLNNEYMQTLTLKKEYMVIAETVFFLNFIYFFMWCTVVLWLFICIAWQFSPSRTPSLPCAEPPTQSFLGESYYSPPHKRLLTRVQHSFPPLSQSHCTYSRPVGWPWPQDAFAGTHADKPDARHKFQNVSERHLKIVECRDN